MNILSINNFNITTPFKAKNSQVKKTPSFNLYLAQPLGKDTVSFQATPKIANKAWEVNKDTARIVRIKMTDPSKKVFKMLDGLFDDLIATDKNPKYPLIMIGKRLKSEESIVEKTGSRKWKSVDEIIQYMTDIIGAKLVLRDPNKNSVDRVLDRFIPLIKSGKLELLEIENKRPAIVKGLTEKEASQYDYASIEMLKKLANIQNDFHKKGKSKQRVNLNLDNDFTNANYCAIHFLFRIPGKNPTVFELQVLGDNVNKAKSVDDIVWKILDGKSPKDATPEIKKLFKPFTDSNFFAEEENAEKIVETAKEKFNKYRGDVFMFQRTKASFPYSSKRKKEMFLPISEKLFPSDIELKYGLSSLDYDFNNLCALLQKGR